MYSKDWRSYNVPECPYEDEDSDEDSDDIILPKKSKFTFSDSKAELTEDSDCMISEDEEKPKVQVHHMFRINGINIEMPVRPYRSQECVIAAMVQGFKTKQHCLLESPTGSGKTLALLCGSLAWQKNLETKIYERVRDFKNGVYDCPSTSTGGCEEELPKKSCQADFSPSKELPKEDTNVEGEKIPTIFYGSRTHKQIQQVIKEFGRTSYKDTPMTILSSRENTCIQQSKRNKTELCNELLDPTKKRGCPYYKEGTRQAIGTNSGLRSLGVPIPWDIEDLVKIGEEMGSCPYFAAKSLMEGANIVFCPYNYIIDPVIRDSMQIKLKDNIVILDEAHNVEDICRDAGSASITAAEFQKIGQECDNLMQMELNPKYHHAFPYAATIKKFISKLEAFVAETQMQEKDEIEIFSVYEWTGDKFIATLDISQGVNSGTITNFTAATNEALSAYSTAKEVLRLGQVSLPTLPHEVIRILEKLLFAFRMVTAKNYESDYRVIVKEIRVKSERQRQLDFMCMNSGVIFAPICELARTVILASGTLSPIASYNSELGVKFPFTIQADHVTPQEQVFIKCVSGGLSGRALRGTHDNVNKWSYQDDLGEILLKVCENVPHGVLMFFTSYSLLNKVLSRWQMTNLWNKLSSVKEIFQEERTNAAMSTMIQDYRRSIRVYSNGPIDGINGSLLFAVFRGKISEGIDFSDNEARCVLTVGIPFAVRFSPNVSMKYNYNDLNRHRGLLSGREWYVIQAYRALNQALGRVIRHMNDWGAIILVDERFLERGSEQNLPAWIRKIWRNCKNEGQADLGESLRNFVAKQIEREKNVVK